MIQRRKMVTLERKCRKQLEFHHHAPTGAEETFRLTSSTQRPDASPTHVFPQRASPLGLLLASSAAVLPVPTRTLFIFFL